MKWKHALLTVGIKPITDRGARHAGHRPCRPYGGRHVSVQRFCDWHQGWVGARQATEVATDGTTAPGLPRHACWDCVTTHGLTTVPRDAAFTGRRDGAPTAPGRRP